MVFDIGAGLSSLGSAVSQFAGTAALEQQKAALEEQKLKLADQLAGAREEKQRAFTTSEREATQVFQGAENEKTRTNQKDIANIGATATVQSAGIHAGATIAAANISAAAQLASIDKQITALAPTREADLECKKIENNTKKLILDSRTEFLTALDKGDIDGQAKAIQKMSGIEFNPKDQYTEASLYQTQAKMLEQSMTAVQARIAAVQSKPEVAMTDQGKALIATLNDQYNKISGQFNTALQAAQDALKRVPNYGGRGGSGDSSIIRYDAQGNRIQSTPQQQPSPPINGMINQAPPPGNY